MATKISVGETYVASKFCSGENARGPWEMIVIKGPGRGSKSVMLFTENIPSGVVEGGKFTVDKIRDVTFKAAKDEKGNWTRNEVVINAEVTAEKTPRLGEAYEDFETAYDLDMDLF